MDEFTKFNNQTAGRDKIFRLVQYTTRILWHNLERKGANRQSVERVKKVDEILGLMRRLLRFGRFAETIHSALPVFSSVTNPVVRFTSAMSRISNGCYLLIDHIVCLQKLGIITLKESISSKLDKMSTRFWLYAIILGLIRDLYEFLRIYKEEYRTKLNLKKQATSSTPTIEDRGSNIMNECAKMELEVAKTINRQRQGRLQTFRSHCAKIGFLNQFVVNHADVTVDTAKNICDLFLPLSSLGYFKLNPILVSSLGIISTVLSTFPMINPMLKMIPAT